MSDNKSLFIPNKFRKLVKQQNVQSAESYEPEYNRLHDEGKLNYNILDQKSQISLKEKLKEDFAKNNGPAVPNIPRIGSNQDHYWNDGFNKNQHTKNNKAVFYDENTVETPINDGSELTYEDLYQNQNLISAKPSYSSFKEEQKKSLIKQSEKINNKNYHQAQSINYHKQLINQNQSQQDENLDLLSIQDNNFILINSKTSEILKVSSSKEEISILIEEYLQNDFELDDLIVLQKLKINVGVILT